MVFLAAGFYSRLRTAALSTESVNVSTVFEKVSTPEAKISMDNKQQSTPVSKVSTPEPITINPKKIMKNLSLSQSAIADDLGISRTAVSAVINHYGPIIRHLLRQAELKPCDATA